MLTHRTMCRCLLSAVGAVLLASPVTATTLVRRGLDALITDNATVVHARVLDLHSYWNAGHTFILTDVHARAVQTLKGPATDDVVLTLLGGSVDGTTMLIVDGPELVPGSEYVLFLSRADLPGVADRWTVPDLSQGVFDLAHGRAFSQALGELLPDETGATGPPGGPEGLALESLVRQVLEHR